MCPAAVVAIVQGGERPVVAGFGHITQRRSERGFFFTYE
jgi:hypothetical protein